MEIRQIRDFLAVVRAGSFAAAARTLNVSQPGLGYQIKQLELDLGAALLIRHSRGVELTAAGQVFVGQAEQVLAAIADTRAKVREAAQGDRQEIRVGLSPTPEQLLGPALTQLDVGDTPVRITFREGLSARLLQDVRSGDLDVAICVATQPAPGLRIVPLYREYLHLIGPPGPAGAAPIAFADLAHERLMTGPREHLARRRMDEVAEQLGVTLNVTQELEPGGLRRSLVVHGASHTIAACGMFVDEIDRGVLSARRIVDPTVAFEIQMVCGANLLAGVEEALLAAIRAVASSRPGAVELMSEDDPLTLAS